MDVVHATKEIYSLGFGGAPEIEILYRPGNQPKLKVFSGYTAQGYTSTSEDIYTLSSSGLTLLRSKTTCEDPNGKNALGEC